MSYSILVVMFFMVTSMYGMEEDVTEGVMYNVPAPETPTPAQNVPVSGQTNEPINQTTTVTQQPVTQPVTTPQAPELIESPSEIQQPTPAVENQQIPPSPATVTPAPTTPEQIQGQETLIPTTQTSAPGMQIPISTTVIQPVVTPVPTQFVPTASPVQTPTLVQPEQQPLLAPGIPPTAAPTPTPTPSIPAGSSVQTPTPAPTPSAQVATPQIPTPTQQQPQQTQEMIKPAEIPSAPQEEAQQIPEREEPAEPEEDEIQGVDTMGLEEPRGNWLFKRIWWERAEGRYDKIRQTIDQINNVYLTFFAKRTELDKTVLDPFYSDIGFKQGELQGLLSELISNLERERQSEGMLSEERQELLATMQEDREFLQNLYRSSQNILLLDQTADKVLERVIEQKARVIHYEQEAWNYMREISRILSDKQARELYYKIDANWRNIKSIYQYLERDLQHYFNQLITDAKTQVQRIKESVQALKEKGFDLKTQAQKTVEEPAAPVEEEEEEIPVKPKPAKPKGILGYTKWIFGKVSDAILWLPRKIWYGITRLVGWKR